MYQVSERSPWVGVEIASRVATEGCQKDNRFTFIYLPLWPGENNEILRGKK